MMKLMIFCFKIEFDSARWRMFSTTTLVSASKSSAMRTAASISFTVSTYELKCEFPDVLCARYSDRCRPPSLNPLASGVSEKR